MCVSVCTIVFTKYFLSLYYLVRRGLKCISRLKGLTLVDLPLALFQMQHMYKFRTTWLPKATVQYIYLLMSSGANLPTKSLQGKENVWSPLKVNTNLNFWVYRYNDCTYSDNQHLPSVQGNYFTIQHSVLDPGIWIQWQ